jgi:hypothetical protein
MNFVYVVVKDDCENAADVGMFREEELKEASKFAVSTSRNDPSDEETITYYIYKVKFGILPEHREECVAMFERGERI